MVSKTAVRSLALALAAWSAPLARGLSFLSPTAGETFSTLAPLQVAFSIGPADPAIVSLFLYSAAPSLPLGPSRLKSLVPQAPTSLGSVGFSVSVAGLPPGDGYAVVAARVGQSVAVGVSGAFSIINGSVVPSQGNTLGGVVGVTSSSQSLTTSSRSVAAAASSSSTQRTASSSLRIQTIISAASAKPSPSAKPSQSESSESDSGIGPAVAPGGPGEQNLSSDSPRSTAGWTWIAVTFAAAGWALR